MCCSSPSRGCTSRGGTYQSTAWCQDTSYVLQCEGVCAKHWDVPAVVICTSSTIRGRFGPTVHTHSSPVSPLATAAVTMPTLDVSMIVSSHQRRLFSDLIQRQSTKLVGTSVPPGHLSYIQLGGYPSPNNVRNIPNVQFSGVCSWLHPSWLGDLWYRRGPQERVPQHTVDGEAPDQKNKKKIVTPDLQVPLSARHLGGKDSALYCPLHLQ
jgi:hypothetical protein